MKSGKKRHAIHDFLAKIVNRVYNRSMKKSDSIKIEKLKERYLKAFDDNESVIELVSDAEISENVYNSNAIENSTLTLEETEKILLEIDLDRYISQREMFEAKNLARIMQYINHNAKKKDLDENMILFLHKMLMSNINNDIAGRFRKKNEMVRVGSHIAPHPNEITDRIKKALLKYNANSIEYIVKRISKLHLEFEYTHPFVDGNGRIGRIVNNYLFVKEGYVPINIKFIDRSEYYDAFKEYDMSGRTKIMDDIITRAVLNSYHKRLAYLEGKKIMKLSEYAKSFNESHSNLLNKAKRQTIEAFLEKGIWKIGV